MIEHFDLSAALVVVVMLGLGAALVEARAFKARQREAELREAIHFLDMHYECLLQLDDPDTPVEVLELALEWNAIIHDRNSPAIIAAHAGELAESGTRRRTREANALTDSMARLTQKRPDLTAAFIRASLAGIEAFLLRYPKCRPALGHMLLDVASAPAEETMRVVRIASGGQKVGSLASA